jgi:sialidase-1
MLVCFFICSAQAQMPDTTARNKLPYDDFFTLREGLNNFYKACLQQHTATVAFLGGSITYNPGWRNKVCSWLTERFPETRFRFIAAGIPSLGSLPHAFRLQRDVLDSGTIDLLFIEAAVNDRVNGTDSLTQIRSLEGIIRHARMANPYMDIIMLSFADPSKTSDYDKGIIPVEIANHERIAAHYQLPSINLGKEVHDKIRNHEFDWAKDFRDIHPSPFGQELYFNNIKQLLLDAAEKFKKDNDSQRYRLSKVIDGAAFVNGSYLGVDKAKPDASWTLLEHWTPKDSAQTREGFVNVPVLEADKPGATLTLSFTGTAAGMAVLAGPDAGIIEYSIDHANPKKISLYTEWSNWLHLPWYVLFGSGLENKQHVIKIKISNEQPKGSKGHACRIVHFLVNK